MDYVFCLFTDYNSTFLAFQYSFTFYITLHVSGNLFHFIILFFYISAKPMLSSESVNSWVVIVPTFLKLDVKQFVAQLRKSAGQMEWRLCEPNYRELSDDKIHSFVESLRLSIMSCNPKFILIVLPTNRLDRYRHVFKLIFSNVVSLNIL